MDALTELQNRGGKDFPVAFIDGLKEFPDAINAAFPQTQTQLCIGQMVCNSLKYVTWRDYKAMTAELKLIYRSATEEAALNELGVLAQRWGEKYPQISRTWYTHWENLNTLLYSPEEIRRAIYTTNAIESLSSVIRNAIKKGKFRKRYRSAKKITLSADNYIIHKSAMTKCFLERNDKFKVLFQPAYHPWVHRIELVWKLLHDTVTRNHKYSTMKKLMDAVSKFMASISPFPGGFAATTQA